MKKLITLFAAVLMAVGANAENKVFKITVNTASPNPWDAQCFINLKNVQKGKANVVKMKVKTSVADAFKIGTESIDDLQTDHKSEWGASAVFNYTDEVEFSSDWTEGVVNFPGVTNVSCHTHCTLKEGQTEINHEGGNTKSCDVAKHENFEYAATAILLNFGKAPANAELYIDDITVYDGEGNVLSVEDFENATIAEYDNSKTVYYPAWQGKATFEIVEMTTTGINDVKVAAANAEFVNAAGQKVGKNYKGLVINKATGKKYINK